jgi:hypothetical protein
VLTKRLTLAGPHRGRSWIIQPEGAEEGRQASALVRREVIFVFQVVIDTFKLAWRGCSHTRDKLGYVDHRGQREDMTYDNLELKS